MKENGSSGKKHRPMKYIIPAIALILIITSIFFLVAYSSRATKVFALRPFFIILIGAICLYLGLAILKRGIYIFAGISATMIGSLSLLVEAHILPYRFSQIWPLAIIIFGLALLPAGIYYFRRPRSIYLFPAITMILLGAIFMLFSLDIVKISLAAFFIRWWPLLLLISGILLLGIFFVQQIMKKDFPYMEDDSLEDETEVERNI